MPSSLLPENSPKHGCTPPSIPRNPHLASSFQTWSVAITPTRQGACARFLRLPLPTAQRIEAPGTNASGAFLPSHSSWLRSTLTSPVNTSPDPRQSRNPGHCWTSAKCPTCLRICLLYTSDAADDLTRV